MESEKEVTEKKERRDVDKQKEEREGLFLDLRRTCTYTTLQLSKLSYTHYVYYYIV